MMGSHFAASEIGRWIYVQLESEYIGCVGKELNYLKHDRLFLFIPDKFLLRRTPRSLGKSDLWNSISQDVLDGVVITQHKCHQDRKALHSE